LARVLALESPEEIHPVLSSHWVEGDRLLRDGEVPAVPGAEDAGIDDVALRMMFRDLVTYLPDDILTKVDRASMAVSLEARVPLLDHRIVAFAWSLPLGLKVRGSTGKWILRQVLQRYVPQAIVSGPKMGFGVPMADWLRGPLREWAEALIEPRRLAQEGFFSVSVVQERWREFIEDQKPYEHHLWDVLMFQAWLDANRAH
jgi:asparagine synthase (glutamine-hydrolysing)